MLYGAAVWLLAGLFQHAWWLQFACFVLAVLLVMRMNSKNLLIRIYSRSVSVAFIFLSCAAVFLFPSLSGGIVQLCAIGALLLLCDCYQDKSIVDKPYLAFLLLGIGTMLDAHVFFYLPIIWLLMLIIVFDLSWRTFLASLLGLATPYWFLTGWMLWQKDGNFHVLTSLYSRQDILEFPFSFATVPPSMQLVIAFTAVLMVIGAVHFIHSSSRDKIRVRQLYYGFITLGFFSLALLVVQPHNELALRMLILAASPLIGHYWALTGTRLSNIIVITISTALVTLTLFNLWTSLSAS